LNLEIVKALCGEHFYPNILLLTTVWDKVLPNQTALGECCLREKQLLTSEAHWGTLRSKGCQYMRYYGTRESGLEVLRKFQIQTQTSVTLRPRTKFEQELVTGIHVRETQAGAIILMEQKKRRERVEKELMEALEEEKAQHRTETDRVARYRDTESNYSRSQYPHTANNAYRGQYPHTANNAYRSQYLPEMMLPIAPTALAGPYNPSLLETQAQAQAQAQSEQKEKDKRIIETVVNKLTWLGRKL
jgi:hypothetical protein